jgi:Stage II sporulation protein E (SpoIIE)
VRWALSWTISLFWLASCSPHVHAQNQRPAGSSPSSGRRASQQPKPADAALDKAADSVEVDATNLGSPIILRRGWRVGVTSDPAAANADFNDSAWAVREAKQSIADISVPDSDRDPDVSLQSNRRYVWFREHIKLAPNHGPVSLLIELPVTLNATMTLGASGPGLMVFANGRVIHPEGPHGEATYRYQQITRLYDLGLKPTDTSLTLAIRTLYIPFGYYAYTSFFANRTIRLGNPDDLQREWDLWFHYSLFERLPRLVNAILLTVLALFLLVLYFTQKGHSEYLWLALHELIQAPLGFVDMAGSLARIDQVWYGAMVLQLIAISAYLYFRFIVAFLSLRRRRYVRLLNYTAPILVGIGPSMLLLGRHGVPFVITLGVIWLGSIFWIIGWSIFIFATLIAATIKRNFEAGMLLIPLILTIIGIAEPILIGGMGEFGGTNYRSPLTLYAGPIPIHFAAIADFASLMAIIIIVFTRFLRIHHEQERASGELAAARSVQELMIPHEKIDTPGYEVQSVYNPANEVGGDFFHIEPTADGGVLIILGDVAGKGLQAAMNVSMLVGALRRTPDKSPARILESLNRVLLGSESFTTCQAVWFGPNGELVLANAGHLPPYLNTQEVRLPGGLPLGVVPDVTYDEVRLYLHPGDRILMMSDGVVEARQSTGELFGFDRVHNLSNQSAFYIADAAKAFGQEDDITVLTVKRLDQAMAA